MPASSKRVIGMLLLAAALIATGPSIWAARDERAAPGIAVSHDIGPSLLFEENVGQFDEQARFVLRSGSGVNWLAQDALWITVLDPQWLTRAEEQRLGRPTVGDAVRGVHLKLTFEGANPEPVIEPFDRLHTRISYFIGDDSAAWYSAVPVWAGVRYRELYPGIDLVLSADGVRSDGATLPWQLESRNGADVSAVQLRVEGAESVSVAGNDLRLDTGAGLLFIPLPPLSGEAVVSGASVVNARRTGPETFVVTAPFAIAHLDTAVNAAASNDATDLVYSTFLGGRSWDAGLDIAVDDEGAAYVTGLTPSTDFPTVAGSFDTTVSGTDAFVVKLNPAGDGTSDLVYSTFLGGALFDAGYGIGVSDGEAYVTGVTESATFPTTPGAFDRTCGSDGLCDDWEDGFIARLSADGTALLYATYLGGKDQDRGDGIAVSSGTVHVTGMTKSDDFPTTPGAFDRTCGSDGRCNRSGNVPLSDAFFVNLAPIGTGASDLLYGTYLGGRDRDSGADIAVGGGDAYVAGWASSFDFPATGYAGGGDAFVVRLNPAGDGPNDHIYGTFVGGGDSDSGEAIAVTGSIASVTGETRSTDFPATEGVFNGGLGDAFVARLDGAGNVTYAAFLGGSDWDGGNGIAVDGTGTIVLTGHTQSTDFPTTNGAFDSTHNGQKDVYLTRVDLNSARPQHIAYSSFLGGTEDDVGNSVEVDQSGNDYLTGYTASANFPTTPGAFDPALTGIEDGFVAKLRATFPPVLDLQKLTNGSDADAPPGHYLPLGEPVNWQYIVTNDGDSELSDVQVTDDQGETVSCPSDSVASGGSMTCTASGTAQAGQYVNLGTVTASTPSDPDPVSATDLSHYFGAVPHIGLAKLTNGQDSDAAPGTYVLAGGPLTWTYVVTNTGNVPLANITVSDDQGAAVSCPWESLLARQAMACTATGTAVTGQYTNTAVVTGTPPGGMDVVVAQDVSHYFGTVPGIAIEKRTNNLDANTAPGPGIRVEELVSWTYAVTNTGNVELADVGVTDDQGVAVSCPKASLAPEERVVCTASGTTVAGQYANTGTATGTPPVGPDVTAADPSHYFGLAPELGIEKLTNDEDADTAPGPIIQVGQPVTWTYAVTNTGNVTLTGVTVADDQAVAVSCPKDSLAVDESMTCTATGSATAGQYNNLGTTTGTPPIGANVSASDPSHYFGSDPDVAIEKLTNGEDADTAPGPLIPVGGAVEWTYVVTNTGNITLTDVVVTDDEGVEVSCPEMTLAPEQAMTCTAEGTADRGQYRNVGNVTAAPPVGENVDANDASHYFGSDPQVQLQKYTNGQDADNPLGPIIQAGQEVTWTYAVSNTGNITLTNIVVSDDRSVDVSCPSTTLSVDAAMTCTAEGAVTVGLYANLGTVATAEGASANDPSHYTGLSPGPAIDVQKTANGWDADIAPGPVIPVGGPVAWEYWVTNVGNDDLADITLTDSDAQVRVTCPRDTLAVMEYMTCTASSTAVTGQYSNTATVTGTTTGGEILSDIDLCHYFGSDPEIDIKKRTNSQDADEAPGAFILVGEPVTWTYVISNTGNVTLTTIAVEDDDPDVTVGCPADSLSAGRWMTCTATGTAVAGQYTNLGRVTALPPVGTGVTAADASHYFGAITRVAIAKRTNGQNADEAPGPFILVGEPVTWTYVISNTGNVTLTTITVEDDDPDVTVGCPTDSLSAGRWMTCIATGTAVAGQYANSGRVTASPPVGTAVTAADASHYFGAITRVAIAKRTNGRDADDPPGPTILVGETVTWTYAISNTGNVTLPDVLVSDDRGVTVSCPKDVLGIDEPMTCTATGKAQAGQYRNTGTVTGTPSGGLSPVTTSDDSHYFGARPAVSVQKLTNGQDADDPPGPTILVGETVTWTYVVGNTGNVTLTDVLVSDDRGVTVSCPQDVLGIDEPMTCTATGKAQIGQYRNTGTATGTPPDDLAPVTASDDSHYFGANGAILIQKLTNSEDADDPPGPTVVVGRMVTWTYIVSNSGNVMLSAINVADSRGVAVKCPASELAVGQSMACTGHGAAVYGEYANVGTAAAYYANIGVSDSDPSHYVGVFWDRAVYLPLVMRRH